ncbi:hypothetical protein Slin15195_G003070 [Septoria linicola]|uniref:Uncharacterized protein n=1 Tax=Septoria linicola TaxID=215465 RepID=A0A9Q9AHI2_9PEZI|nr:hypothetical protein Slin14017_G003090 [Septoria linicola]USW46988.1 hypothetical protein Slin15195_G003070 [Septoria linicola]
MSGVGSGSGDGIHPTGPSQPAPQHAYEAAGNPTSKNSVEASRSQVNAKTDEDNAVAHRGPNDGTSTEATPTARGHGVHGAPPGEESRGISQSDMDRQELEADQMAAPGEGKIRAAVQGKAGASGREPGLETDIEKKKAEQAPAREAVKAQKQHDVDVGGVLGQRGGPANPVDKNNYPNSGD